MTALHTFGCSITQGFALPDVEPEPLLTQLEDARRKLDSTLAEPYVIPNPADWYTLSVDHDSCRVILDPEIPPAENDMHPSVLHHARFAEHVHKQYFEQ